MRNMLMMVLLALCLPSCKTKKAFSVDIDKLEVVGEQVLVHLHFHSDRLRIPDSGRAYLLPAMSRIQVSNGGAFRAGGVSSDPVIVLNRTNYVDGVFSAKRIVDFPLENLSSEHSYRLEAMFNHPQTDEKIKVSTPTFVRSDIEKRSPAEFMAVDYGEAIGLEEEVQIPLYLFADTSSGPVDMYIEFDQEGKRCSPFRDSLRNLSVRNPNGWNTAFRIRYDELYIPPGEQLLGYTVYVQKDNRPPQALIAGTITITQPQLYFLSFETRNADIDASGMDGGSFLGRVFSKKRGRGLGDAYYVLRRGNRVLYQSRSVSNSGNIPAQKGWLQVGLDDDDLRLQFLDRDDLSRHDVIDEYPLQRFQLGNQTIQLKDKGRIRRFDFSYSLSPVTNATYDQVEF